MKCPKCQNMDTKVVDSRNTSQGKSIRRRRECEKCSFRFTTFERLEIASIVVVKKEGTREPYDRVKLEHGIWLSCGKRPITHLQITNMINELEEKWTSKKEISTEEIGEGVMNGLKKLDNISYIRFASVYRDFRDIDDFHGMLQKMGEK